jgi:hypothetical protein
VVIPARKRWFAILFLSFWLVGWAFGEVTVTRQLMIGTAAPILFLLAWLAFWTVGGAFAFATVAWSLAGREVVSLESGTFAIRREVLGVGRTWEYNAADVRNLRISTAGFDPFSLESSLRFWGISGGPIAFDYGARTLRFGSGIDEAEAASIVSEVHGRMPWSA